MKKGLIIKPYWLELILNGKKTWEVRSKNTKIRGKLLFIASGHNEIWGEGELVDSFKLSKSDFLKNTKKHCCTGWDSSYPFIWVLKNIKKYKTPKKIPAKTGPVIFRNL